MRGRRVLLIGVPAAVGVALAVVLLTVLPVPQQQSFSAAVLPPIWSCPSPGPGIGPRISGPTLPKGATVDLSWSAPVATGLLVRSCAQGEIVYVGNGTSGAGSFVSVGGEYVFGVWCLSGSCVAPNVTVSYAAPLFPIW